MYESKTKYFLLLCRERYDFTLFATLNNSGSLGDDFYETITNRGDVIDFAKQENGSYEIWIRDFETKENFVYYFFDYKFGIIKA